MSPYRVEPEPRDLPSATLGAVVDDLLKLQPRDVQRKLPSGPLVYCLGNGTRGMVKVGITTSLARRVGELENASGGRLWLLGVIRCESAAEAARLESRLHDKYAVLRGIGEWFIDAPELLAEFEEWQ